MELMSSAYAYLLRILIDDSVSTADISQKCGMACWPTMSTVSADNVGTPDTRANMSAEKKLKIPTDNVDQQCDGPCSTVLNLTKTKIS